MERLAEGLRPDAAPFPSDTLRGTDTGHWGVLVPNVLTDIFQLYSCDICYVRAAGLIRHLLNHVPGIVSLQATGHSLGGGMAQFGVAANVGSPLPVGGVAVNAAGLSGNSLQALGADLLAAAAGVLDHITTCCDPVSTYGGGLVGGRYRIPRQNAPLSNGHGIGRCSRLLYGGYRGEGETFRQILASVPEGVERGKGCSLKQLPALPSFLVKNASRPIASNGTA